MKKQCKIFDENVMEKAKFERDGFLIDVILQEFETKVVLFGASMRREDLEETIKKGIVVLWSKSRKKRWAKGETSGNFLKVVSIVLNCDDNQLLIKVMLLGKGACHTKDRKGRQRKSCFFKVLLKNKIIKDDSGKLIIKEDNGELILFDGDWM